jgi:AraC-like DNA-binding protein
MARKLQPNRESCEVASAALAGNAHLTDANDFTTTRFSTDDLPEKDRVAIWREQYGHTAFQIDVEPAKGTPFRASITSRSLPGLSLWWGSLSAACLARTRELAGDGNDDLLLFMNYTGSVAAVAGDREVVLRERDAVLIRSDDVGKYDRFAPGRSLTLRMPRPVLSRLVTDVDDAAMRHISRKNGALRLLMSYAGTLTVENRLAEPALVDLAVSHVHDLVALTLGATRDTAGAAQDRGVTAARLAAAKTFITRNSSRRELSVGAVAAYLGVSPRYVQRLFETDGTTFSEFLLDQRLTRAHRMLSAPQSRRRPVSVIAFQVGFGDLSYFNRCFRRFYGFTPRDIRQAAARELAGQPPQSAVIS